MGRDERGGCLSFWVYLILSDLNLENLSGFMHAQGVPARDIETMSQFLTLGLQSTGGEPIPALKLRDQIREGKK